MQNKTQLRQSLKATLGAMGVSEREAAAKLAASRLLALPFLASPVTLGLYASIRQELSTTGLFNAARASGHEIYFPKMCHTSRNLLWGKCQDTATLKPGKWDIPEPACAALATSALDVIVVPGLGFGLNGGRLGYGAGWYDRSLVDFEGIVVGFAFECQVLAQVPLEEHDQMIDWIITELREIAISR